MALSQDELAQVADLVHQIIGQRVPIARDGMIVAGTYDPTDATVSVLVTDTLCAADGDQPTVETRVPLATGHLDDIHGPFGGELVHLVPLSGGGYTAHMYLQPGGNEGPQTPVGERWTQLRSQGDADGHGSTVLTYVRHMQGGGAGALAMLAGAKLTLRTAGGFAITFDDAAKAATIASPGGLSLTLDDNARRVMLGHAGLAQPDALVTQTDAQALATAIVASVQAAFVTLSAHVQSGSGTPPPTVAGVTAMGSSVVESAE